MNRIYRSVWNEITRTYVAAAEIVRGKGKGSSSSRSAEASDAFLEAGSPLTGATGEQGPPARPAALRFGGFRSMALEQRFMFDGAAVDTAVTALGDVVADTPVKAEPHAIDLIRFVAETAPQSVSTSEAEVNQLIGNFLAQPQAREQLFALFNGGQQTPTEQWQGQVDAFLAAVRNGDFQISVKLLDGNTMQGSKGAFSATGTDGQPVIYLNRDWLQAGADSGSVTTVLTEELGHAIDHFLNGNADTAGDEGEAFSSLLRNGQLRLEAVELDDAGVIQVNGQDVSVEFASYTFVNAYKMVYDLNNNGTTEGNLGETAAEKEQSTHNFNATGLGQVRINDETSAQQFSGNDVSATSIVIGGQTYNGWISRPIKSGGVVRGFYFWTDKDFTMLALAQADGNMDGDSNSSDNSGFLLVVDQAWFTAQISSTATTVATAIDNTSLHTYSRVGSSSDRVDSALNALLTSNTAPTATGETASGTPSGTASTSSGNAALEQGYNSNTSTVITATINGTGNVLANDSDGNGDTLSVTTVTSKSTGSTVTASSAGTAVTGKYGTLTIRSDGNWTYAPDNANAAVNELLGGGNLQESFTYTVSDGRGGTATATLTVQINGSNDAPVASNDYNTAKEITSTSNTGYTATGNVLPNDTDVDTGDTKTITGSSVSGSATANVAVTAGTYSLTFTGSMGFSTGNAVFVELGNVAPGTNGTVYTGLYTRSGSNYTLVTVTKNSSTGTLNTTPTYYYDPASNTFVAITNLPAFFTTYKYLAFANYTDSNLTTGDTLTETSSTKTQTVSSTSGSGYTTLSGLSLQSGTIAIGMTVTGTGVPTGTTVTDVTLTSGVVTSIRISSDQVTSTNGTVFTFTGASGVATTLTGQHGTLVLQANGSYVYTPFTDNAKLSSGDVAQEVFDYTMQDTAGATSAAKLYITVYGSGSSDPALASDTATAYESGVGRSASSPYSLTSDNTAFSGVDLSSATVDTGVLGNDTPGTGGVVASYTKADGSSSTNAGSNLVGSYGTLNIAANGTYTYAVANANSTVQALLPGSTLTETFRYRVTNTAGGSNWSTLTVTIQGTNDRPTAVADTGTLTEDADLSASGNVLNNDTDVDSGDTKVVSKAGTSVASTAVTTGTTSANGLVIGGIYGTLTIGADGTYQYVLATSADATRYAALQALTNGSTGTETFNYEVKDSNGATNTTTLTFTINGANEAPVNAFNGTAISSTAQTTVTTAVNTALDFTGTKLISVSDSDANLSSVTLTVEHGSLSFSSTPTGVTLSASSGATLSISGGTQAQINAALALLRYTPNSDFSGTDFLTIASADSLGARDSDGIAILIPKTTTGSVDESALSTGSNLSSTTEAITNASLGLTNGQSVIANQTGTASHGTWSVSTSGTYSYTLSGRVDHSLGAVTDSFNYTAYDSFGNAITNTVVITINDDGPTAKADSRSVTEGTVASPTANLSGNVLTAGSSGDVADTQGADAPVTVTKVIAGNATPTTTVATGSSSSLNATTVSGSYGQLVIGADGSYIYDLNDDNATVNALNATSTSLTETFSYTIRDSDGSVSTSTLTITVTGTNDAPVANSDTGAVNEDATLSKTAANGVVQGSTGGSVADSDVDNTTASLQVSGAVAGTGTVTQGTGVGTTLAGSYGHLTLNVDGSYSYVADSANALAFGMTATDTFTYTIKDADGLVSNTATLTITVTGTNDAPVAINDSLTVNEGDTVTANVITANDTDAESAANSLQIAKVGDTGWASLTASSDSTYSSALGFKQVALSNGLLLIKQDGTTVYRHNGSNTTSDSFTYTVTDGTADSASSATVSITINPVNGAPVFVDPANPANTVASYTFTYAENKADADVLGTVKATDADVGTTLAYSIKTNAYLASDTLQANPLYEIDPSTGAISLTAAGVAALTNDFEVAPNTRDITVTASDGTNTTDITVTLTETNVNDNAPTTSAVTLTAIAEDSGARLITQAQLLVNAADVENNTLVATGLSITSGSGTLVDNGNGTWTYTPALNDDTSVSFSYTITDNGITNGRPDAKAVAGTATLDITPVNDAPIAAADTTTTQEDTPVTIDVLANDSDVDGPSLNIKFATVPPEQGTVAIVNGKLVFSPAKDFNGTATITYVVTDGSLDTPPTPVTVLVTSVVDPVTVSSPTVNEASPYAMFTVTGGIGETVALELGAGSAAGDGTDFGSSESTQLELSTDGGLSWAPYSAAATFPADGKMLARTSVKQDSVYEGSETFTLKATPAGGDSAVGTATILDDGTGTIFNADGSDNPTAKKDDDRPITIAPVTVNEAAPYAVFRVEASGGQQFTLSLRDGPVNPDPAISTATAGADYRNSLETYDGVKWIAYTPGSLASVPAGGSVLLVRVPVVNDSEYEGAHAFTLAAIIPDAVPVTASGIIGDYGTGAIFNDSGAENRLAPKDDDRGIQVDSPIVNEGSEFVIFTVNGDAGPVGLRMPFSYDTDEPIATGVDKSSSNIQFWENGTWKTYDGSNASIPAAGTLLVRVSIVGERDRVKEGSEHFALIVSRAGQDSLGEASVRDDGTGVIFQFAADGTFTGTTTTGLDDDFDQDGITPTTEEALATLAASQGIGDAVRGDLNGDGLQDADQNALATLAWTTQEYFNQGNDGTLTESKAIISIAVVDDATSKTVSQSTQLLNIQVAKYQEIDATTQVVEQAGSKTVTLANGFTQVKTPWDPIRFAVSGQDLNNDGQLDTGLADVSDRPGTQVRILIDIRASGLTTQDVNGYIKYVSQEAIDAAGGHLTDLDGLPITKAGWYDFTQRKSGGDGARFIDENGDGKIDFIELIITDNAFGDNDPKAGKIFDPGVPVLIDRSLPVSLHRQREELPYMPPKGEIQFTPGPRFEYLPFDSTLYALAAEANPKALDLIERTTWSWMSSPDRDWLHDRYPDPAAAETGWTPAIVPAEQAILQVLHGMPDQFAKGGAISRFAVPADAFAHSQADVQVSLKAERSDGSELPTWLEFDAAAGVFRSMAPENFRGELRIRLSARDTQSREASTLFRFHVGDKPGMKGRSGLSEQLRDAAQHKRLHRAPAAATREAGPARGAVTRP